MTDSYTIRPLNDYAELRRAVEFQKLIWGNEFDEVVPPAVLWFTTRVGGLVAGAFEEGPVRGEARMIGLLFGVTGWDGEQAIHWSDMLAVHPSARGRGIGFALKAWQRDRLLEQNVRIVNWTFDPLESRNAWLNFARLGVTSKTYLRDVYGASSSPLHRGIGTDRLVVEWRLDSDRVRRRMEGEDTAVSADDAPVINPESRNPESQAPRLDLDAPAVWLRVPTDIQAVKERDAVAARRWREQTRTAFEAYFGRGYEVVDVAKENGATKYLLRCSEEGL